MRVLIVEQGRGRPFSSRWRGRRPTPLFYAAGPSSDEVNSRWQSGAAGRVLQQQRHL